MADRGTETEFELTTIERLEALGYKYVQGKHLDRTLEEVVLRDVLRRELRCRYPDLLDRSLDEAVAHFARPEGVDPLRRNMAFHLELIRGVEIKVEREDGGIEHRHVHAVDWGDPAKNEFLVVNQLPVRGNNHRRPDLLVYVNGPPLVLFELKNPIRQAPDRRDCPQPDRALQERHPAGVRAQRADGRFGRNHDAARDVGRRSRMVCGVEVDRRRERGSEHDGQHEDARAGAVREGTAALLRGHFILSTKRAGR
jgi:hypothetical protein